MLDLIIWFKSWWCDALFAIFLARLLCSMINLYGLELHAWDMMQIWQATTLFSGDPLIDTFPVSFFSRLVHAIPSWSGAGQPASKRGVGGGDGSQKKDTLASVTTFIQEEANAILYLLNVGACIMQCSQSSDVNARAFSLLAVVVSCLLQLSRNPENIGICKVDDKANPTMQALTKRWIPRISIWGGESIIEQVILTSFCRGLYWAFLVSVLPIVCMPHQKEAVLYSHLQMTLHFGLSFMMFMLSAFLLLYIQHRGQIVLELRRQGRWTPERPTRDKENVGKKPTSDATMWKSGVRYYQGQLVSLPTKGGEGGTSLWRLTSESACSQKKPPDVERGRSGILHAIFAPDKGPVSQSKLVYIVISLVQAVLMGQALLSFFFARRAGSVLVLVVEGAVVTILRELVSNNFQSTGWLSPFFARGGFQMSTSTQQ